jgi:hypothetical protein
MNRMTAGKGVSGLSAALAILGFFLPWALVSCMGQAVMPMSGYEIASGTPSTVWAPSNNAYSSQNYLPGASILYITLGAAIVTLLFFLISYFLKKGSITLSVLQILVGLAGLYPFFLTIGAMKNQFTHSEILFSFDYQYGFWLTIIGFAGIIIGGFLNIADSLWEPKTSPELYPPPNIADQLEKLVNLYSNGKLTFDEFESAKKRLFS